MKKTLSFLITLLCMSFGFSQTNPWSKVQSSRSSGTVINQEVPSNMLFSLDIEQMNASLKDLPIRGKSSNRSMAIIQFPNANGILESFSVVEAPVMHPELALKYPNIKSYAGRGLEDQSKTIRFSISPKGLQSMRLGGDSDAVFIEPFTKGGVYSVYNRKNKPTAVNKLQCLVDEKSESMRASNTSRNADDSTLRTYRLAVSTNGEYTQFHGGTKAGAMAAINATMTRVNGVFENDFAVTMVLIPNNDDVIYTNANSDPYTGNFNSQLQSTLTSVIGESNYDIGHLFARAGDNGNAGCIGCVCVNGNKGSGFTSRGIPEGDAFDIDYVAHEIGHQFGANHTFSFRNEGRNAHFEPGSGSTIMGYAGITGATDVQQNSDPYFHFFSIQQVTNYVKSTSCQTNTTTGNTIPTVNAGADYTIPRGTPFVLTGQASDADGDSITYCWEQADENDASTTYPSTTGTSGVSFRSLNPTTSNKRYFPRLSTIKTGTTSWQWEAVPNVTRALNFRLTVRDNKLGGAGNNSDDVRINVTANAGPFIINSPNTAVTWNAGTTETVTWNVAGTTSNGINAANVDILLSTDGGDTYTQSLATGVANDGSQTITVPNLQGNQNRIMVRGSGNIFFDISNTNFTITGGSNDNQAPTAPTNLTAQNITQTSATLNWNASTDNVGVSGYDVYNGTSLVGTTTETSYLITGLISNTAYSFKIRAKDAAGNISNDSNAATFSTLPGTGGNGCTSGLSNFPYNESFENTLGTWTQSTTDDINWSIDANGTPSTGTGPASASNGTYYLYIEASGNGTGYPNKKAILTSGCFDLNGLNTITFGFNYHMFGAASLGSLALEVSNDNGSTWNQEWFKSGNQGNNWFEALVDLSSYANSSIQIRFVGISGTTWQSDIAIDAINLSTDIVNPPTCTNINLALTFDDYPEETSWQITNSANQTIASGGTYADQPDGSTISIVECLEDGTYTFTLSDSYGDGICCQYGNGSYELSTATSILASGGSFGSTESTTFTLNSNSRGTSVVNFETTKAFAIKPFPNPLNYTNKLTIQTNGHKGKFVLRDLLGRSISQGKLNSKTIDLPELESGSYILTVNINGKISNHQIIKQ
ncbi:reprolysin-like metallopeptidase [Aquimarina sp. W85]|uniref:reprolysin-like metallopeptidase n=1 Tax=Aquimarina rhodophyticola TaxID=3342246 RepID=UPI00366A9E7C